MFSTHNFTVEFYGSVFLVKIGSVPNGHRRELGRLLNLMSWIGLARNGLILIFLCLILDIGGIAESYLKYSGYYFKVGGRLKLGMSTIDVYTTTMNTWASWVESMIVTDRTRVLFWTFEGSHWSDAHVGTWSDNRTVPDSSHWCLPGVPDAWNEILFSYL
nr:hypothetical protein [Tanacetum cinerariifolium]